jgi:hypothetical protein
LLVEWEDGSDRIGSFSWCSYTCVVTDEVRGFLESCDSGCEFGRIQVVRPSKKAKRPRVAFPYAGPQLHWLRSVREVDADVAASHLELRWECPQCGRQAYQFKREGLVLDPAELGSTRIFQVRQFSPSVATFVTEDFLFALGKQKFVNIEAFLAGAIS